MPELTSSQELQALLDAAVDAIIVIDHRGTIQSFNKAAEQVFGYPSEQVLGRNVGMLMTDADSGRHDAHIARYCATRVAHVIGTGRQVEAKRRDGTVFPAFLSVGAVEGVEPARFVGFVRDITAVRKAEEDAHRLQDRLMHVSRLATVGEMASGIAHELNQPLAAIATFAHACDRLLGQPESGIEDVRMALKQIAEQAVRAGDIIRRLRTLAKNPEATRTPTSVNALIEELTDLIQSDARAHGIDYRSELAPDLPQVILDRAQIQQVIINLVRNALEAFGVAPRDAAQVVIRTRLKDDGNVQISICDNGPGVELGLATRIFDPFCSTKATGTGLGLAISRTIVSTHGGVLDYEPNVPVGACFNMQLPPRA